VLDEIAAGKTVLLEIDLAGARQVRRSFPQATQVFIAPPSWDELRRRLHDRGAETPAQMSARLDRAKTELAAENEFDHVIVNDDLSRAVDDLVVFLGLTKGTTSEQRN
jgi:guanylate kinase